MIQLPFEFRLSDAASITDVDIRLSSKVGRIFFSSFNCSCSLYKLNESLINVVILLMPFFIYSQNEYKYESNNTSLPNWVKEMYKENPNPGKVEALYKQWENCESQIC